MPPLLPTVPLGDGGDFTDEVTEFPAHSGFHISEGLRSMLLAVCVHCPLSPPTLLACFPEGTGSWDRVVMFTLGPRSVQSPPHFGCAAAPRRAFLRARSERFPAGQLLAF